jgi:hypothetical protein
MLTRKRNNRCITANRKNIYNMQCVIYNMQFAIKQYKDTAYSVTKYCNIFVVICDKNLESLGIFDVESLGIIEIESLGILYI